MFINYLLKMYFFFHFDRCLSELCCILYLFILRNKASIEISTSILIQTCIKIAKKDFKMCYLINLNNNSKKFLNLFPMQQNAWINFLSSCRLCDEIFFFLVLLYLVKFIMLHSLYNTHICNFFFHKNINLFLFSHWLELFLALS